MWGSYVLQHDVAAPPSTRRLAALLAPAIRASLTTLAQLIREHPRAASTGVSIVLLPSRAGSTGPRPSATSIVCSVSSATGQPCWSSSCNRAMFSLLEGSSETSSTKKIAATSSIRTRYRPTTGPVRLLARTAGQLCSAQRHRAQAARSAPGRPRDATGTAVTAAPSNDASNGRGARDQRVARGGPRGRPPAYPGDRDVRQVGRARRGRRRRSRPARRRASACGRPSPPPGSASCDREHARPPAAGEPDGRRRARVRRFAGRRRPRTRPAIASTSISGRLPRKQSVACRASRRPAQHGPPRELVLLPAPERVERLRRQLERREQPGDVGQPDSPLSVSPTLPRSSRASRCIATVVERSRMSARPPGSCVLRVTARRRGRSDREADEAHRLLGRPPRGPAMPVIPTPMVAPKPLARRPRAPRRPRSRPLRGARSAPDRRPPV